MVADFHRVGVRCRTCKKVAIYVVRDDPESAMGPFGPRWIEMTIAEVTREHAADHPLFTSFERFDPDAAPDTIRDAEARRG